MINDAYKKGTRERVPIFHEQWKVNYIRNYCYPTKIKKYTDMICNMVDENCIKISSYITNGGWESRKWT